MKSGERYGRLTTGVNTPCGTANRSCGETTLARSDRTRACDTDVVTVETLLEQAARVPRGGLHHRRHRAVAGAPQPSSSCRVPDRKTRQLI
jgi:hypothetical protein